MSASLDVRPIHILQAHLACIEMQRMEGLLRTQAQVRSSTQNKALLRAFANIQQYSARISLPQSIEVGHPLDVTVDVVYSEILCTDPL